MQQQPAQKPLYVDQTTQLHALCQQLQHANVLVLDTEFIREKTYYPELCLIQIATPDVIACVDTVVLTDLQPLLEIIYNPKITKVLHAARQDYEIFYHLRGNWPQPLFDTQIAASLLGLGEQTGYAALVHKILNVQLDKSQSRTDWKHRPLSQEQISYASDDVYFLLQLYPILVDKLRALGRETWLAEDFAQLCDPALYVVHPEDAWQKVKGFTRLKPRQLAALQLLAAWREQQAIAQNKPRRWILSDDSLLGVAQLLPTNSDKLQKIRSLRKNELDQYAGVLLQQVKIALEMNDADLPRQILVRRPSPEQEILADLSMTLLRMLAQQNELSPANLATRKDIERLINGNTDVPLLHGWRNQIAGNQIQQLLAGELSLAVKNQQVTILQPDSND